MLSNNQIYGSSIFIMSVGLFVLLASTFFIGMAANQLALPKRKIEWILLPILAIWYGSALTFSIFGEPQFPILAPFILFPILLGILLSFWSPIKQLLSAMQTHWLIYLQFYRVAGGIFLFPYLTEGVLTSGFALNAGIGDMTTGVLAIPVGWMVMRDVRWSGIALILWSIFGISDLIVAPASAFIYGADGLSDFPISFIPLFLGPPLGILLQIITLRVYWLKKRSM